MATHLCVAGGSQDVGVSRIGKINYHARSFLHGSAHGTEVGFRNLA